MTGVEKSAVVEISTDQLQVQRGFSFICCPKNEGKDESFDPIIHLRLGGILVSLFGLMEKGWGGSIFKAGIDLVGKFGNFCD